MTTQTSITAEQLAAMPSDGGRCELIAGELHMMTPAGWEHGKVIGRLHFMLAQWVFDRGLGEIFSAETGFLLARNPDTVRAPDIAFIHRDHLPAEPPREVFWPGAPDLAVEVVSAGDTFHEVDDKAMAWLAAGTRLVWVVNPRWHTVTEYRSGAAVHTFTEADELSGGEVIPGFRCALREVFGAGAPPAPRTAGS